VDGAAAVGAPVFTGAAVAARTAHFPGTVDRPEGRGGQGDEEPGPPADRGGDVLAAEQTRADQVESVARMEAGAGGADGCPSVAAADGEAFAGFGAGVVVVEDLAGRRVQGGGRAGQVDGVGASAGCGDLLQPARELGVLCEAYCVEVCFGELTQARRAVEDGAPVSRGVVPRSKFPSASRNPRGRASRTYTRWYSEGPDPPPEETGLSSIEKFSMIAMIEQSADNGMPTKRLCFVPCPKCFLQMVENDIELRSEVRSENYLEGFREPILGVILVLAGEFSERRFELLPGDSHCLPSGAIRKMAVKGKAGTLVSGELVHHLSHCWRNPRKTEGCASVLDLNMESLDPDILCTLDFNVDARVC
jgi:hypothetical protein